VQGATVMFKLVVGVTLVAQLCACASVERLPEGYQTPSPLPRTYLEQFCYEPVPIENELVLVKEKKPYRVFEGSINAGPNGSDDDAQITFEFYEPSGDSPSPVILLMPILNGQKHLMRPFATKFARNGYAAVIIDTVQRRTLLDDLGDPEPAIRLSIQRHRRVIDWVETRPDLDASRIAVFGASLGGFNALYLSAMDPRVSVATTALVGGSLPYVLVNSDERRIVEATEAAKARLSMDDEQLLDFLGDKIETDVLALAAHMNADRVLMVLTKYDTTVPYDSQLRLHDAMGNPEAITLPTSHNMAAAYLFYLRSRILKFFDRKLSEQTDHGTAVMPNDLCVAG
jgi:dienelactone hydrolase